MRASRSGTQNARFPENAASRIHASVVDAVALCEGDYSKEVSDAALAHVIGDQTEAAYARGDLFNKRAGLMQDWADYLAGRKAA